MQYNTLLGVCCIVQGLQDPAVLPMPSGRSPEQTKESFVKTINKDSPLLKSPASDVKHPPPLSGTTASFRNEICIVVLTQGKHCVVFSASFCNVPKIWTFFLGGLYPEFSLASQK